MRVFENKVLRRIFGPRREEIRREWRTYIVRGLLTCTVLLTTYYSTIKSIIMRSADHVAEIRTEEVYTKFWWGKLREELEKKGFYGRIILTWIFLKWYVGHGWIDLVEDRARWLSLVNEGS